MLTHMEPAVAAPGGIEETRFQPSKVVGLSRLLLSLNALDAPARARLRSGRGAKCYAASCEGDIIEVRRQTLYASYYSLF